MKTFRKTVNCICMVTDSFSMIMLCICVASAFANTIFRYVFNAPIRWSEELCVITLIWMVYVSQPSLENSNNQLCMTAAYNAFPKKLKDIINVLRSVVTVFVSYIIVKTGWQLVQRNFDLNINTQVFDWPYGIIYFVIPLSFAIVIIVRLADIHAKNKENDLIAEDDNIYEEAKQ